MITELGSNYVAVVQGRLPEAKQAEQQRLDPIFQQAEVRPYYIDALNTNVEEVLSKYSFGEMLFMGSADGLIANLEGNTQANLLARIYLYNTRAAIQKILSGNENIRAMGICYGHQAIAYIAEERYNSHGRNVIGAEFDEVGTYPVYLQENMREHPLFNDVRTLSEEDREKIEMVFGHHNSVLWLPHGASVFAKTRKDLYSGLYYDNGRIFTFQGHPEIDGEQAKITADAGGYKGEFYASDNNQQILINFIHEKRKREIIVVDFTGKEELAS